MRAVTTVTLWSYAFNHFIIIVICASR
jgi:hypothetical protein